MEIIPERFSFRKRSIITSFSPNPFTTRNFYPRVSKIEGEREELEAWLFTASHSFQFPKFFKVFENAAFVLFMIPFRVVDYESSHVIRNSATSKAIKLNSMFIQKVRYIL